MVNYTLQLKKKKKRKTFLQSKNTTYSRQLQKHAFHTFYNKPHISPCSRSSEGGPENVFLFVFELWPMLFPLVFCRSRLLGQCINLMFCHYSGAQIKNIVVDLFPIFFTLLFPFCLTQLVLLTLALSHSVSCQSVLWVSLTQMSLHL